MAVVVALAIEHVLFAIYILPPRGNRNGAYSFQSSTLIKELWPKTEFALVHDSWSSLEVEELPFRRRLTYELMNLHHEELHGVSGFPTRTETIKFSNGEEVVVLKVHYVDQLIWHAQILSGREHLGEAWKLAELFSQLTGRMPTVIETRQGLKREPTETYLSKGTKESDLNR